ncbi:DNA ligase 1 [Parasteatoda tepidariorum]|uniref:DNA ligase 1 n=1 Tax=Parasteatoda tepidariorum TaxID=114398 RepID=UPI001C722661|nr:uncharacterized protein LOC107440691 [Parasteatoda tepidariorum]
MYQTRRQLLKVNTGLQNSAHPEVSKINLRKRGKKPSCESLSNSAKTICIQSIDKENVTTVDSVQLPKSNKQNGKIKPSNVCRDKTVIHEAENRSKSQQKEKSKAKKRQVLTTKENVNFKSVGKTVNSVVNNLIYNKCLKKGSKVLGEKIKQSVVDVYDINVDDDLKKEELDLKKVKKLKLKDKKEKILKKKKCLNKSTKLAAKDKDIIQSFKNKTEIQSQVISSLTSKKCNDLNIQEVNPIKSFPKSEQVDSSKLVEEFCLEVNVKNKDSGILVLRETTPVRELDFNIPNEGSVNSGASERLPGLIHLTSTPQNAECPCPTFTSPVFSFDVRLSEVPTAPLLSEVAADMVDCPEQLPDENEPEYVTASNDYSLVLFGSPQKDEEKINEGKVLHFAADDERKNKNKKKKPDPIVQKKSNAEKQEEEAFYRSFNQQLSEIEDYELCIE